MITLYGINNCDTIKKTKNWFNERGIEYHFHDYKKLGCSAELCDLFLQHFEWQELINTRGTTWRKLADSVKQSINESVARELMQAETSIIKRPIVARGESWLLGFNEDRLNSLLDSN